MIGPAKAAYNSVIVPVIAMLLSTLYEGYRWTTLAAAGAALAGVGLRVPDDVALVSMGGTRVAAYTVPTLTTMRQDVEYLAGVACAELLRRIREPGSGPTEVRLRGNLVVGRSCGC